MRLTSILYKVKGRANARNPLPKTPSTRARSNPIDASQTPKDFLALQIWQTGNQQVDLPSMLKLQDSKALLAWPIADQALTQSILDLVQQASHFRQLKKGANEGPSHTLSQDLSVSDTNMSSQLPKPSIAELLRL